MNLKSKVEVLISIHTYKSVSNPGVIKAASEIMKEIEKEIPEHYDRSIWEDERFGHYNEVIDQIRRKLGLEEK